MHKCGRRLAWSFYIFILAWSFYMYSEKTVQESEGVLMVCIDGVYVRGGGVWLNYAPLAWWLVVSGIVPKTVDLLPNSCDRIWTLKYILHVDVVNMIFVANSDTEWYL